MLNWLAKVFVGLLILFSAYDFMMPVYNQVELKNATRVDGGIQLDVRFQKIRGCAPITGTVVSFLYFGDDYRLPVTLMDEKGNPVVFKNFPPSDIPVNLKHTWQTAEGMPNPTAVSMGFYVKCLTRVSQHIEWRQNIDLSSASVE